MGDRHAVATTYQPGNVHVPGGGSGPIAHLLFYADGHAPLWKAFWLWGVLLSWILFAVFAGLASMTGVNWGLFALATIVMMPYTAWILVAVWQCAFNTDNDLWGYLARFLTLVWAVNVGIAGGLLITHLLLS